MQETKVYLLDCGTITHVVNSHYHIDHCGGNKYCTHATTICHQCELEVLGIAERLEDGIERQIECAAIGTPSRHGEPDSRNRGTPFVDVGVHRPFSGWSSNWQ